jgi:superfamily II DNA or RNA helicase
VRAEHLDGTVSEDARRACLRRLKDGLTQVVSNVNVLTEGFDEPAIKYVALARPTQSLSLYMQMGGRDMRPWFDVVPILVDHSRNVDRFGLPHEDRVWGLYDSPRLKKPSPYRTCPKCYAYVLKNPCELCGYAPTPEERRIREARATTLVERVETDVRRVFFLQKLNEARTKGFKAGYPSAKYKEKFGEWPPWSWGEEAKHGMTAEWQARIERRQEERGQWTGEGSISVDVPDDAVEMEEVEYVDDVSQEEIEF